MQTRHLTSLTVHFNPLSPHRAHRIPRLLLARLPAKPIGASGGPLPVKFHILPRSAAEPARISVGFKGGETLEFVEATRKATKASTKAGETALPEVAEGQFDLGRMGIMDVLEEVGRRCRVMGRKEQMA